MDPAGWSLSGALGTQTYDGLSADDLARRFGAGRIVLLETTGSTLDVAHDLGAKGASGGTLVLADEQTAGRGRLGRRWISPRGAGIWLTLLIRPRAAPLGGVLAVRAGLATVLALEGIDRKLEPRLKWPNDVMVQGRKAGGILCEARWSGDVLGWVAVGVGINVIGPVPEGAGTPIALAEVAPGLGRLAVLEALVPRLRALETMGSALEPEERARFTKLAWPLAGTGEQITDLTPDGALLVRRADGSLDRRTEPA
ncbi:MAG: biotin--[acetyl-CoA-carboxylase] ligase [Gemmatimonadales bacterium]